MKQIIFLLILMGFAVIGRSQSTDADLQGLHTFNQQRFAINKRGFLVLSSWSAANIISGIAGTTTSSGQAKYFHQMNAIWGAVNLAIALPGYIGARKSNADLTLAASLKGQAAAEKTFIFNAGLDLAYIAGAVWLVEKGNTASNSDKYKGYGKSVLMQGAFLLVFDAVMFASHNQHGKKLYRTLETLKLAPNSVGLNVPL